MLTKLSLRVLRVTTVNSPKCFCDEPRGWSPSVVGAKTAQWTPKQVQFVTAAAAAASKVGARAEARCAAAA